MRGAEGILEGGQKVGGARRYEGAARRAGAEGPLQVRRNIGERRRIWAFLRADLRGVEVYRGEVGITHLDPTYL